jgi:hypothetical protein
MEITKINKYPIWHETCFAIFYNEFKNVQLQNIYCAANSDHVWWGKPTANQEQSITEQRFSCSEVVGV